MPCAFVLREWILEQIRIELIGSHVYTIVLISFQTATLDKTWSKNLRVSWGPMVYRKQVSIKITLDKKTDLIKGGWDTNTEKFRV